LHKKTNMPDVIPNHFEQNLNDQIEKNMHWIFNNKISKSFLYYKQVN
jgi:hypothetical protein